MEPRARFELATCRLRSVNRRDVTNSYGLLSCSVFLAFRVPDHASGCLLSAIVCHLGVHQFVHQVLRREQRDQTTSRTALSRIQGRFWRMIPELMGQSVWPVAGRAPVVRPRCRGQAGAHFSLREPLPLFLFFQFFRYGPHHLAHASQYCRFSFAR